MARTYLLIRMFLVFGLLVMGVDSCDTVDMSKAEVKFKHTIKLPAGFSIESSVPLDLNKLNSAQKNPEKFFEQEKFSLLVGITNDDKRRKYTKINLQYDKDNIAYLYLYAVDGVPLKHLGDNFYEFDADMFPRVETSLYVAGVTKSLPENYPHVAIDFKLNYVDSDNQIIADDSYELEVYKRNYSISDS